MRPSPPWGKGYSCAPLLRPAVTLPARVVIGTPFAHLGWTNPKVSATPFR